MQRNRYFLHEKYATPGLQPDDSWQAGYLQGGELAELKFWLGQTPLPGASRPAASGADVAVSANVARSVAVSGTKTKSKSKPKSKSKAKVPARRRVAKAPARRRAAKAK